MKFKKTLSSPALVIIALWIFLTAINIEKPFHGDDTFHLEAAKHIIEDPLHPMSGVIRWDHPYPEPMFKANQPPLLFYMIAGVTLVFGFNEIPLHILISIFSFLSLFWFYKISVLNKVPKPLLLLLLFGLCPAFVVNQNVMTDIPLLAILLGVIYYISLAEETDKYKYNVVAIMLLSIGLLIKYTLLPVLAAIALLFTLKKQFKNLALILIPIGILSLWSLWNYLEYGGIHIFERNTKPLFNRWDMLWSFISCLGSVATFGLLLLNYILKGKLKRLTVYGLTALFVLIACIDYFGAGLENKTLNLFLEIVFFANGLVIVLTFAKILFSNYLKGKALKYVYSPQALTLTIVLALSLFLVVLAPFIATRHILLIIPLFLLLSAPIIANQPKWLYIFSVSVAFTFSTILGISDWQYANIYKKTAKAIADSAPPNGKIWATGAGGWQWYTVANGMHTYLLDYSNVIPGDYIVIPKGLHYHRIDPNINKTLITKLSFKNESNLSYFSTKNFSMYHTSFGSPAWKLSKVPIDTIYIVQCIAPINQ